MESELSPNDRSFETESNKSIAYNLRRIGLSYFLFFVVLYLILWRRSVLIADTREMLGVLGFFFLLSVAIVLYVVLVDITRVQFREDGLLLQSVGKIRINLGKEEYVLYSQLNVEELAYWSFGLTRTLKISRGDRRVCHLSQPMWEGNYKEIKAEIMKRLSSGNIKFMA